jgi:hypothetical protein
MPGSPSASEKAEARRAVTAGLTDDRTARTLQDAGDSSKRKREQIKAERERRERQEQKEREERAAASSKKCMPSPLMINYPLNYNSSLTGFTLRGDCIAVLKSDREIILIHLGFAFLQVLQEIGMWMDKGLVHGMSLLSVIT